tara:strand:+ start:3373 stop:4014 length:642 start_codon:yes stop_codon:yes gene_type:complete
MRSLDLREIPIIYINLDRDIDKKEKIEKTLGELGFKNIIRSPGFLHSSGNRGGCSMAHHNALKEIDPPFIIIEDDAEIYDFDPEICFPDDADAVYLGISSWGRMNGHSGPFVQYDIIDDDMLKVYNMLGTHAILYLSDEYVSVCTKIAYHQFKTEGYIDVGFTDVQKYYNVYSFDSPLFYQSSSNGTHGKLTSYPTSGCFKYYPNYFLPERVN